ncbi:MAG: bifunctional (p)ppGpp synthetase/guanosine-3',5'-bis(diphosphate) 3'-pyrophosphohydrolase [Firmicutes bacterium]|nr:bifunctional (p)ppGpp synthetase/guanosine-3',5'-bis(diphosphate) 3'-pyrophosphohydrolase [Bacillota bacterium]
MKKYNKYITYEDLYEKIKDSYNEKDLEKIKKAYEFAEEAHKGKKRLSGEDYITHPLNVAYILSDINVDHITLMAALLHETINHTDVEYADIKKEFGELVADLVNNISKINKLELPNESESSAIYLRKVLVGLASDMRVIYIKLADRLHNMRTVWALDPESQRKKATETMMVLIPIAHRLGINDFKSELENLCLYYTKTDVYKSIEEKLQGKDKPLSTVLSEMQEELVDLLASHGLKFKIKSRVKSVYSIYNKLNNGKRWEEIFDILALRIILETENDCYTAIGLIHSKYKLIPKRFKDYIANPKKNNYQSLHTGIYGCYDYPFEVQIRTYEMDEYAEKGNASHWSYKEKGNKKVQEIMEQKLEIFRSMIENTTDDKEFVKEINDEILNDVIYVFTPKKDAIELPKGATPVDFAYRIHSDVGDKTVGALVNGNIVPLDYELQDGEVVSIKTKNDSTPSKEWLDFVKSTHAKNKIKSYFSKQDRIEYTERGKEILETTLRKKKLSFNEVLSEENLKKILTDLKLENLEELYFSIGTLRYTAIYIINLTKEDKKTVTDVLIERVSNSKVDYNNLHKSSIIVAGNDDIKVNLAKCCKPVKGDEIIGYVTKGEGVTVHKKSCENITSKSERLIDVSWNDDIVDVYHSDLIVETPIGGNYLVDIVNKASIKNIYIDSINTKNYNDKTIYELTVKVKNKEELNAFVTDINNLTFVRKVTIK